MEFINVCFEGKVPFDSQKECGTLECIPLTSIESIRFFFEKDNSKKKKKKLTPYANPVDFEEVTGADVKTTLGCLYHLPVGTARRLYMKVCNSGLTI